MRIFVFFVFLLEEKNSLVAERYAVIYGHICKLLLYVVEAIISHPFCINTCISCEII